MTTQKNILILCSWSHRDPLVHRYVLPNIPLIKNAMSCGCKVHLQTYETDKNSTSTDSGIAFDLLLKSSSIEWKPVPYAPLRANGWFLYLQQIIQLRSYCRRHKIHFVHAFAPVAGAVGWIISRWSNRRFILDSWEPHAESMVETGVWPQKSMAFRILWALEKRMARDADFLIAAQPEMREYALEKWNINPLNVAYRPACTDMTVFDPSLFNRINIRSQMGFTNQDIICVCLSQLGGLYYMAESLQLFNTGKQIFGSHFKVLLITATPLETITTCAHQLGIEMNHVTILQSAPEAVPSLLAVADFAFNPQKAVPSKRYGTPVKNGEYWSMGLPILMMAGTSQDSQIAIQNRTGIVMPDTEASSMIEALHAMKGLLTDTAVAQRCRGIAQNYRHYKLAQTAYQQVYDLPSY